MFTKISSSIKYPDWTKYDPRWKQLDLYDKLLDGKFYDHLVWSFYDEVDPGRRQDVIKIESRRPCAQYNLPNMVARWCARKLFGGRHVPRIRHPDKDVQKAIQEIAKRAKLNKNMLEIAYRGSVGAVAASFRIETGADGEDNIAIKIWKARDCTPSFDSMGELNSLRIHYVVLGANLLALGAPGAIDSKEYYWFIRDFMPSQEVTYVPVKKDDWNPILGFVKEGPDGNAQSLVPWELVEHRLGIVPAHWFVNLTGGESPDGACTWKPAIPNSIEIDYMMSQNARGVRYNNAPQLVVKGDILPNFEPARPGDKQDPIVRGPTYAIFLQPDKKDGDGNVIGGSDAKLLEMNGAGTEAALKSIDNLRNMALEEISASRKDPEKAKGPMSGRAMEYMDEEFHDLIMELRSQYGEEGALPLLKKIVKAIDPSLDISQLDLQWPRLYQPSPDDIQKMIEAFALAIDPLQVQMNAPPPVPGKPDAEGKLGAPIEQEGEGPPEDYMLLTIEECRAYLKMNLDLNLLDIDGDEPNEPEGDIRAPAGPGSNDGKPNEAQNSGEDPNANYGDLVAGKVGAPVKVRA